jgi:hypothetical protein
VAATKLEVQRLLDAGFICEIQYPSWLANVVMVMKKNGKWIMCTNFTNLNKCYPNDDFLVSRIEKVVDSTAGCETMALLECFSEYHQIWLCEEDEEKTSFMTPFGTSATSGCPNASRMLAQQSVGGQGSSSKTRCREKFPRTLTTLWSQVEKNNADR